jgi:energy-coupling factor transporter ATP-binding protein EcfA2
LQAAETVTDRKFIRQKVTPEVFIGERRSHPEKIHPPLITVKARPHPRRTFMQPLITTITGQEPLGEADARAAFEVLVPIIRAAPDHAPAVEAAQSVLQRTPNDLVLSALMDWWLVVYTGVTPSTNHAYNPPASLPGDLTEIMSALIYLRTETTVAEWVRDHRQLQQLLADLEDRLLLDWYGSSKLPGERPVWQSVILENQEVIDALKNSTKAPEVSANRSMAENGLVAEGVQRNSRRYREIMTRVDQLHEFLTTAVTVQHRVEPWIARQVPNRLSDIPTDFAAADSQLERSLFAGLVVDTDEESPTDDLPSVEILERLRDTWGSCDRVQAVKLARVTEKWFGTLSSPTSTHLRFAELEQLLAKLHRIDDEVRRFRATDTDTTAIEIHVLDGDVDAANEAITAAKHRQQVSEQRRREVMRLDTVRARIVEFGLSHEFDGEVVEIAHLIDAEDIATAAAAIGALSRQIDSHRRDALTQEVSVLLTEFHRLDASPDVIDAVSEIRETLINGSGRPDDEAVLGARRDLESLTQERLGQARRSLEAIDETLTELSHVASDIVFEWRTRWEECGAMSAELDEHASIDDVAYLFSEASVLFDEVESHRMVRWTAADGERDLVDHVIDYCTQEIAFDEIDIRRFYVAVKTKPFVILAGLTGSGKSTIARLFAGAFGATSANGGFRRVAVRPDWIDQSEVLGFVNPMTNIFHPGWLAKAARDAGQSPDRVFVVLVDELNLAPVEQYLAEYLSASEEARSHSEGVALSLYNDGIEPTNGADWPYSLAFPPNLIVIGTVNMDETTRVLSDRVIDRASVLQLSSSISDGHHVQRRRSVAAWDVPFGEWRRTMEFHPVDLHHEFLVNVADTMRVDLRIGLGIRSHIEMERFIANSTDVLSKEDALDIAMLQRVIPKIRGFKRDLASGLEELLSDFRQVGADRCAMVLETWLSPSVPDDEYLDGTSHLVGLVG